MNDALLKFKESIKKEWVATCPCFYFNGSAFVIRTASEPDFQRAFKIARDIAGESIHDSLRDKEPMSKFTDMDADTQTLITALMGIKEFGSRYEELIAIRVVSHFFCLQHAIQLCDGEGRALCETDEEIKEVAKMIERTPGLRSAIEGANRDFVESKRKEREQDEGNP